MQAGDADHHLYHSIRRAGKEAISRIAAGSPAVGVEGL